MISYRHLNVSAVLILVFLFHVKFFKKHFDAYYVYMTLWMYVCIMNANIKFSPKQCVYRVLNTSLSTILLLNMQENPDEKFVV